MKYSIPEVAKAVGAFVVSLGLLAGTVVSNDAIRAVLPASWLAWLAAFAGAAGVAATVFGIGNKLTEDQVRTGAKDLGIAIATDVTGVATKAAGAVVEQTVKEAAQQLPPPAKDVVTEVAETSSDLVQEVLNDFRRRAA